MPIKGLIAQRINYQINHYLGTQLSLRLCLTSDMVCIFYSTTMQGAAEIVQFLCGITQKKDSISSGECNTTV